MRLPPALMVMVPAETRVPADWSSVPVMEAPTVRELEPPVCTKLAPELTVSAPVALIVPPELVTAALPERVIVLTRLSVPPETVILAAAPVPAAPIAMVFALAVPLLMTG